MDHRQGVKLGSTGMNRIDPTTSLRHGALERLRFIDARLFWEARINRADLIETFSVSPAQAALDFKEYLKMAGRGVVLRHALEGLCQGDRVQTRVRRARCGQGVVGHAGDG